MSSSELPNHQLPNEVPRLIAAARNGSRDALGTLLNSYRTYLKRAVQGEIGQDLQGKLDASDLAQETLLEAQRDFRQFKSSSHSHLKVWLAELLRHNVLDLHRRYRQAGKRQINREVDLDSRVEAQVSTHWKESRKKEQPYDPNSRPARLQAALARLPANYREILEMRHSERLRFPEIGERLGKTPDAARMFYRRALESLKSNLSGDDENCAER